MRCIRLSTHLAGLCLTTFLINSLSTRQAIHAQTAPAAGTRVVVKMIDTVDSASYSAGRQYGATVTAGVNAGNGLTIARGSAATGQHVSLPVGTSLTFTPGQPATSAAGGSNVAPTAATAAPATPAAPAPAAAAAPSTTGAPPPGNDAYYCRYYGQKDGHAITYITPVLYETTQGFGHLSERFYSFMKTTYDIDKIQQGAGACRRLSNDPATQANSMDMMEKQGVAGKGELIRLTWTDSPAEQAAADAAIASSAAAAQYAAAHPAAPFISCSTRGTPGVDIYVTGIFQTTKPIKQSPNGAKFVDQSVIDDFNAYLTQKGYKFTPGNNGSCDVSPTLDAAQTAQHTRIHGGGGGCGYCGFKVIETGWKE